MDDGGWMDGRNINEETMSLMGIFTEQGKLKKESVRIRD